MFQSEKMKIEIIEFHRGLHSWVCTFFINQFHYIAYRDRELKCWMYARQDRFELEELQLIDEKLTDGLKDWLKIDSDDSEKLSEVST